MPLDERNSETASHYSNWLKSDTCQGTKRGATDQSFTSTVDDTGDDRFLGGVVCIWRRASVQSEYVGFHIFQSVMIRFRAISDLNARRSDSVLRQEAHATYFIIKIGPVEGLHTAVKIFRIHFETLQNIFLNSRCR